MNEPDPTDTLDGSEPAEVALPKLVDAHGGRLYQLGLRFCGDPEQAQDLVQETFLQAFRAWDKFEGRSKPSTWLYTIAANTCKRFHRKRVDEPDQLESLNISAAFEQPRIAVLPSREEGPLDATQRAELERAVQGAIASLPVAFRMPFVLKEIAGLGLREIAEVLGEKPETIKTRVHRARLRIQKAMEPVLPERELPPAVFDEQVCRDLLAAKQECLDRGVEFEFPNQVVCERCSEVFRTMDFAEGICTRLGEGKLPEELRRTLLEPRE